MLVRTIKAVLRKDRIRIAGLDCDPFVRTSRIRRLDLLAQGVHTTLYQFTVRRRRYALKALASIHHRDTLESLENKKDVLETVGYPAIYSINHEHQFYIMEFVRGNSVFEKYLRAGRRKPRNSDKDVACRALLHLATTLHRRGWLLNDLSWRNFVVCRDGIRPVDPDRVRTTLEEARYLARLDGKEMYTTPLFMSLAQCLNRVPSVEDEVQGLALMIDSLYCDGYLIGEYLEARRADFSRRHHAMMLSSGFYPASRRDRLPDLLREPVERILAQHDRSISSQDLLQRIA